MKNPKATMSMRLAAPSATLLAVSTLSLALLASGAWANSETDSNVAPFRLSYSDGDAIPDGIAFFSLGVSLGARLEAAAEGRDLMFSAVDVVMADTNLDEKSARSLLSEILQGASQLEEDLYQRKYDEACSTDIITAQATDILRTYDQLDDLEVLVFAENLSQLQARLTLEQRIALQKLLERSKKGLNYKQVDHLKLDDNAATQLHSGLLRFCGY